MSRLCAGILVVLAGASAAQGVDFAVGTSTSVTWFGYMNVFERPANGGGYAPMRQRSPSSLRSIGAAPSSRRKACKSCLPERQIRWDMVLRRPIASAGRWHGLECG